LELHAKGADTVLKLSDATIGLIKECDKVDGWRQLLEDGLKKYVERAGPGTQ
jgi:hypothetical protein